MTYDRATLKNPNDSLRAVHEPWYQVIERRYVKVFAFCSFRRSRSTQ